MRGRGRLRWLTRAASAPIADRQRDDRRRGGLLPGQRASTTSSPRARWDSCESRVVRQHRPRCSTSSPRRGVHATFFVLGWVAERYPALVRRIADARPRARVAQLRAPARLRPDAATSSATICAAPEGVHRGRRRRAVRGYRAPSYSITERSLWALDVLIEEGYAYDASIFPIRHDRYGIPDAPRHPHRIAAAGRLAARGAGIDGRDRTGATVPIGGGYFRLLPYSLTTWAIGRSTAGRPAAGDLLPPSVGDRSRPAAPGGVLA